MGSPTNTEHKEARYYIGTHIIADFWGSKFNDNAELLRELLINAAHASNSVVLESSAHQFEPEGSTALILLAESHISAHTWPEYDYIALDVFTCGKNMQPKLAIDYLEKRLKPKKVKIRTIRRGNGFNNAKTKQTN